MAEIQYQLAPGLYVNETADDEYQIAPSVFVNETVAVAGDTILPQMIQQGLYAGSAI